MVQASHQRLRKQYGLSLADVVQLYERQGDLCPVCDELLPAFQLRRRGKDGSVYVAIDHDPVTGKVRGVLHGKCNSHLVASNTIATAANVLRYLENRAE